MPGITLTTSHALFLEPSHELYQADARKVAILKTRKLGLIQAKQRVRARAETLFTTSL